MNALNPKCDFCSSLTPIWLYRCESFTLPDYGYSSNGNWVACQGCYDLIENHQFTRLKDKALDTHPNERVHHDGLYRQLIGEGIYVIHTAFLLHQDGDAIRYRDDEGNLIISEEDLQRHD